MMKHPVGIGLLLGALLVSSGLARLGENQVQFAQRYGNPLEARGQTNAVRTAEPNTVKTYDYQGWRLRATFVGGTADATDYQKRAGSLNDQDIQAILQAEAGGGRWYVVNQWRWTNSNGAVCIRSDFSRHHRRGRRLHRLTPVDASCSAKATRSSCIDNLHHGQPGQHRPPARPPRFEFIKYDVTELHRRRRPGRLHAALRQPGQPDRLPRAADPDPEGRRARHAQGARPGQGQGRARFLLASTSEVYGDPLVHPQKETYWGNVNPIGPRGVYDEAKRFAEAMTMAYHRYHGVNTRIVRIFNTYGPRMRLNDGRVVPAFMSCRRCATSR
jgi:hypothetical protein